MFSKDLSDYIVIIENIISEELRDNIITGLRNSNFVSHKYNDVTNNTKYTNLDDNELEINFDYFNADYEELVSKCVDVYVENVSSIQGAYLSQISKARYNKYAENRRMELHVDHIHSLFDGERKGVPVLSILGLLNDDFDGGEFIMWDENLKLKAGDIIIFPSNFLYPHKVNAVSSSERFSVINWAW